MNATDKATVLRLLKRCDEREARMLEFMLDAQKQGSETDKWMVDVARRENWTFRDQLVRDLEAIERVEAKAAPEVPDTFFFRDANGKITA